MAKKIEIDIEQKEIEAPYELPEGWKWKSAGDIADIYTGNSINEKVKAEKYTGQTTGLNFIGTKDVDFDGSINYENGVKINDFENFKTVPANTPLLCIEGGSSGKKLGFTNEQVCFGNKLCAFVCKENISPKLVYFYLQSNSFFHSFMKERHGLIGGVSVGAIKQISFPLPPTLAEQQRIVNRIENMFAKLDEAKEKAQDAADSFETRKAAILHQAFTGSLTAKWRKENGVSENSWEEKSLGEVVSGFKYGISDKCDYSNLGIAVLRIPNIANGFIDFDDLKFSERTEIEENYIVKPNDILIIRSNGSRELVGKSAIFDDATQKFSYGSFLIKITPSEIIDKKLLVTFLNSEDARYQMFNKAKSSSGIHNINSKELSAIRLNLPTLPEQQEIVRILDTVLEKERAAKSAAEQVLEQIALLKKSILARAFRGEL